MAARKRESLRCDFAAMQNWKAPNNVKRTHFTYANDSNGFPPRFPNFYFIVTHPVSEHGLTKPAENGDFGNWKTSIEIRNLHLESDVTRMTEQRAYLESEYIFIDAQIFIRERLDWDSKSLSKIKQLVQAGAIFFRGEPEVAGNWPKCRD